jgi:hypothetical protein
MERGYIISTAVEVKGNKIEIICQDTDELKH